MNYYDGASIGTYAWAMLQVRSGRDVRRAGWPIEVEKAGTVRPGGCGTTYHLNRDYVAIWHLYRSSSEEGTFKGWNTGVIGLEGEQIGDLGTDSCGYWPSPADEAAEDWMLVSDVTKEQIAEMDARRFPHHPLRYAKDNQRPQSHALSYWFLFGALILATLFFISWRMS